MGLKEQILAAGDRPFKDIPVAEWNCTVRVQTLSGKERDSWEIAISTAENKIQRDNVRAKMLVRALYDKDAGTRIFTDEDADAVGDKSSKVLERLYDVAAKLNGIREGDIEELEKNSGAGRTP